MTGYDLQLHLTYRNNFWNKETEIKYFVHAQKFFYIAREFYRFLHQGRAKFSGLTAKQSYLQKKVSGEDKVANLEDFSRFNT